MDRVRFSAQQLLLNHWSWAMADEEAELPGGAPFGTAVCSAKAQWVLETVCGDMSWAEVSNSWVWITQAKEVVTRGSALWEGVWKSWRARLLGDRFMCFHLMPHSSSAVLWPAHFLRSLWFRIQIVCSPPSHSPTDSDMFLERIPGNTNPSEISVRVACLEAAALSFVHLPLHWLHTSMGTKGNASLGRSPCR